MQLILCYGYGEKSTTFFKEPSLVGEMGVRPNKYVITQRDKISTEVMQGQGEAELGAPVFR